MDILNRHIDEEIKKFESYREQCYQVIDLSLIEQAKKQEIHDQVLKNVQLVLHRESEASVIRQHKELKKQMEAALQKIEKDQKDALSCVYPRMPGKINE